MKNEEDEVGGLDEGTILVMGVWTLISLAILAVGLVGLYYLIK